MRAAHSRAPPQSIGSAGPVWLPQCNTTCDAAAGDTTDHVRRRHRQANADSMVWGWVLAVIRAEAWHATRSTVPPTLIGSAAGCDSCGTT